MITAKEARLATTNNFESSLTDKQFALFCQIENWIEQAVENGLYSIDKSGNDLGENWLDEHRNASITRLTPYYEKLGYRVFINFASGSKNVIIRWD